MNSPARGWAQLLVAHGTRKPEGVTMVADLAQRVSELLDKQVRVAFVDVLGPTPRDVLSALPADQPVRWFPRFWPAVTTSVLTYRTTWRPAVIRR